MAISGIGLAEITVGSLILWSGVTGKTFAAIFKTVASGKSVPIPADTASSSGSDSDSDADTSSFPSNASLEALWISCGGPSDTAHFASQVAMAESGGNALATSSNPGGPDCTNVGLWQLATPCGVGGSYSITQLKNPILNCTLTIKATGGGEDWSSWADPVVAAVGGHYSPGTSVGA